jgi:integrase/recombinase XerD
MPRKGDHRPPRPLGDPHDPQGLGVLAEQFLSWMRVQNYSERSIDTRRDLLGQFIRWCSDRGLTRPAEITRPILEQYQRYLSQRRKPNGEPLSTSSKRGRLESVRAWFRWLAKQGHVAYNPASELEVIRAEDRLPKCILTASEVERLVSQVDVTQPLGVRNRAILETFYATGIRRIELVGLRVYDVDAGRGTVFVRGKGKKDRVVPVSQRALLWIAKYQWEVRPGLLVGDLADDVLFLTRLGQALTPDYLSELVNRYVKAADIDKSGSCHLLRHTTATLMLENGADVRFVQELLGHARLDTTMIYTRVSISKLKEVYNATHPACRAPEDNDATPRLKPP